MPRQNTWRLQWSVRHRVNRTRRASARLGEVSGTPREGWGSWYKKNPCDADLRTTCDFYCSPDGGFEWIDLYNFVATSRDSSNWHPFSADVFLWFLDILAMLLPQRLYASRFNDKLGQNKGECLYCCENKWKQKLVIISRMRQVLVN